MFAVNIQSKEYTPRAQQRVFLSGKLGRTAGTVNAVKSRSCSPQRHNLIRVMAEVEAGMYHQLLGDLSFLSDQIFPDTATGDYLRMHWSDRVPPLYAVCAVGTAQVKGAAGTAVPAGLVYVSESGKRYFTDRAYKIGAGGTALIDLNAEEAAGGEE